MKIIIEGESPLLEMAKIVKHNADKNICGDFGDYIYFSKAKGSHSARIKFYGGSKESNNTEDAPTMKFDNDGNTELVLQPRMNKKNCPNAYDKNYLKLVSNFVKRALPVLLLVWYGKVDESDAVRYFEGTDTLERMIRFGTNMKPKTAHTLMKASNMEELHRLCKQLDVYNFEEA